MSPGGAPLTTALAGAVAGTVSVGISLAAGGYTDEPD